MKITNKYGTDIPFEQKIFSSGESHIRFTSMASFWDETIDIFLSFKQDTHIIQLCHAVDAIRRIKSDMKINLYIPYFPGGRQDRVCNSGEPLSVKVYANIINALNLHKVFIFDPHSEVTPALINNCFVINNHDFIGKVINIICNNTNKTKNDFLLISPDAGSNKKIFNLSKSLGGIPVVRCDKKRNLETMAIEGTEIYFSGSMEGKIALMVDDICAGGRTFKELAKIIKPFNPDKIYLVVSFFEGLAKQHDLKESGIDGVFMTDAHHEIHNDYFTSISIQALMHI